MENLKTAFYWVEGQARWSQLKALGSSNLVRASVLMPAFGYILLLNDNLQQFMTVKYDGFLLRYLPALWRIWLLFYGSFALAIGAILYSLFCPIEVKAYPSSFDMADREASHHVKMGQLNSLQEILRRAYATLSDDFTTRIRFVKLDVDSPSAFGTNLHDRAAAMIIHIYTVRNFSRLELRIIVLLLFWIGLGLLAIPAGFTFFQVTILAMKHMLS